MLTVDGPVLVLAGAGTGTAALTARLAHLLWTRRAYPSEILSVTFTNKAARGCGSASATMSATRSRGCPGSGTFHAIGAKMLRRHAELVGLAEQPHHPRHRRPAAPAQAAHRRQRPRRKALARGASSAA
ncbi:UvrD-helicase domain-containing protein [Sphingomonas sp. J315]|uniref:UvrD-helicase domain-containing protein n=1 Tax=Sphingomonas sp. J315 TaxID=2898433 RepID=UPI0021ADF6F1|nr:UvrD-helicase domain-containing protein [Sphingomonas sp. J315]UUX99619.1 UvrD-helicase domain-containing protein [Sphingomonas sp. J315]